MHIRLYSTAAIHTVIVTMASRRSSRINGGSHAATLEAIERRFVPPALAGIYAGAGAALLPFYPANTAVVLAAAAAALTFFRPRAGVALALAVPFLPLGNVALALAARTPPVPV